MNAPRLKLWTSRTSPNDWVVENEDTGELFAILMVADECRWDRRRPFGGQRASLEPAGSYNWIAIGGVPLCRPWSEVAKDESGRN